MFTVHIDDKQIKRFMKKSPARALWSMREGLKMTGGHYRKVLKQDIQKGRIGGPRHLDPWTTEGRSRKPPLYKLAQLVRFKVGKSAKAGGLRCWIGFLQSGKKVMGGKVMTIPKIAQMHQEGARIRVTPGMRKKAAMMGQPLKKTTRWIQLPKRPIIEPFWRRNKQRIPKYLEKMFFKKFFGKGNPGLEI
jgi:hypothetical protein